MFKINDIYLLKNTKIQIDKKYVDYLPTLINYIVEYNNSNLDLINIDDSIKFILPQNLYVHFKDYLSRTLYVSEGDLFNQYNLLNNDEFLLKLHATLAAWGCVIDDSGVIIFQKNDSQMGRTLYDKLNKILINKKYSKLMKEFDNKFDLLVIDCIKNNINNFSFSIEGLFPNNTSDEISNLHELIYELFLKEGFDFEILDNDYFKVYI